MLLHPHLGQILLTTEGLAKRAPFHCKRAGPTPPTPLDSCSDVLPPNKPMVWRKGKGCLHTRTCWTAAGLRTDTRKHPCVSVPENTPSKYSLGVRQNKSQSNKTHNCPLRWEVLAASPHNWHSRHRSLLGKSPRVSNTRR